MGPEEVEGQGSPEGIVQGQEAESQGTGGNINPAWNDLLGLIPQQLHSQITPHLQSWDKNYQESIGKVHSQYEPYKPYLEGGIQPDQINYGLQLLDAVENRPEEVLQALQQYYGQEEQPQEQGLEPNEQNNGDFLQNPEFQRVNEMVNTMARLLVQQNMDQQSAQEDEQLEQEFEAAREEHGDFDENWVMAQILANPELSINDAAAQYKEFVQGILQSNNRPGPRVLGPGGGTPNQGVSPSDLDDKGRRDLVAQMLANAQNQSR